MTRTIKIAIQGGAASFHETAAKELFPQEQISTISCASFPELCHTLQAGLVDYAVMAVQNSVAGPILPNYRLLGQYGFSVQAERWLLIDQTLMALPGQRLADIQQIWSHPIALLQCNEYIAQHPEKTTKETSDTADTARIIKEGLIKGVAAIASRKAAELYGLEVLQENVANQLDNYTRFLVLTPTAAAKPANKATLLLPYPVAKFSLEAVLETVQDLGLELTMLQALPSVNPGQPESWVLEIEAAQASQITEALAALQITSPNLQVVGIYPKAEAPLPQDRLNGCIAQQVQLEPELVV
ncbi:MULTISPECIES: prephenate dehydratase [Rufibacter]|uniref:prephenate dehydratase n=1 Tax=Rufibacter quisquiliarum TaxID=1549639 RepID=A0A839GEJ5_9BACT|nr:MULTISPECIES: prephenate dehydratase domain-containing protein [Rufibacter]MBA9078034.1 prephenate dehydratase [Rufibacter quisquiliarum]